MFFGGGRGSIREKQEVENKGERQRTGERKGKAKEAGQGRERKRKEGKKQKKGTEWEAVSNGMVFKGCTKGTETRAYSLLENLSIGTLVHMSPAPSA